MNWPGARKGVPQQRTAVRVGAMALIAASVAVPLIRRKRQIPSELTVAATVAGPLATAVLWPRSKKRDAVLFAQQMWAFTVVHELPYDDPESLRSRLRSRYPIVTDTAIGAGRLPDAAASGALWRALAGATCSTRR